MDKRDTEEAFFAAPAKGTLPEGTRAGRVDPRRALLTLAVVVGTVWLLVPLRDEIAFHFHDAVPVELGDADRVDAAALVDGSFVRVTGVLGNRAATLGGFRPGSLRKGPIQVRQLLGSPLYVEFDQERHEATYTLFSAHTFEGRVVPFDGEMQPVRDYFRARLGEDVPATARLLIVDERPGGMGLYLVVLLLCCAAVVASCIALARSARARVLDDDDM
jgi:hypothetical protein